MTARPRISSTIFSKDTLREDDQWKDDHCDVRSAGHSGSNTEADGRKGRIPKEQQHLVSHGKVLKDKLKIEDYNMKEGETIELTAALLDVMKTTFENRRKRSKKKSVRTQRMEETMTSVSYRMNDMSAIEQTITSMRFQISGLTPTMSTNFDKMSEAFTQMNTENQSLDKKIETNA